MKAIRKITIGLVATTLLIVGCGDKTKAASAGDAEALKVVTEESLGLRKTDIYTEAGTAAEKTEYRTAAAGGSLKIKRAFQDAPPMIPHDTDGMLPIKIGDNQCTGCHMPDVAEYMDPKPTPIPVSHFTDFRPKHGVVDGIFKKAVDNYKNEVAIKETEKLQGSRFNCTLCHAPQSQGNLAVENTFEAKFTSKDGASKSSWAGTTLTDSLDTIKGESFVTDENIANKDSAAGYLNEH
ncbi:nitrate reductase cytochrome c-type subunit [Candidatus Sulfurimonas marisnigri]|uniref:Periplasmic nitrate reductase, electron transfer subunit n=1 Tax=Candidatus Sulfurimonas marisnigri TaxID=2740405 RepID=A0A7S7M071_9BACT|nr:nitrate reductase cytochrome c-type subunit [Candidatus Sulfurimonas marisnigri]QOY54138.1 nitrate reductase cytochrome c-type subunit [Candidatus Sulfurimonas marisnigri]